MKTKALIAFLIMSLISLGLFAEEVNLKLTGKVYIFNRIHPVLVSEGKEYILLVPKIFNIEEGEEISVDGKVIEKKNQDEDCPYYNVNAVFFLVEKITFKGKTYDLADFRFHHFGKGRGHKKFDEKYDGKRRNYKKGGYWED